MTGSLNFSGITRTASRRARSYSRARHLGLALALFGAAACAHEAPTAFATETAARPLSEPAAERGATHAWEAATNGAVPIWVDSVPELAGWSPELATIAYDAARAWATPGVPVRFVRASGAGAARVRVHWRWAAPWGVGGVTRLETNSAGETTLADCWIVLSTTRDGRRLAPDVLRHVLLHELGHSLGLPHSASRWAIMYEGPGAADSITWRDRAALATLYGAEDAARIARASGEP